MMPMSTFYAMVIVVKENYLLLLPYLRLICVVYRNEWNILHTPSVHFVEAYFSAKKYKIIFWPLVSMTMSCYKLKNILSALWNTNLSILLLYTKNAYHLINYRSKLAKSGFLNSNYALQKVSRGSIKHARSYSSTAVSLVSSILICESKCYFPCPVVYRWL